MINIFDEIIEMFNCEETKQDKRMFLLDLEKLIKNLWVELGEEEIWR